MVTPLKTRRSSLWFRTCSILLCCPRHSNTAPSPHHAQSPGPEYRCEQGHGWPPGSEEAKRRPTAMQQEPSSQQSQCRRLNGSCRHSPLPPLKKKKKMPWPPKPPHTCLCPPLHWYHKQKHQSAFVLPCLFPHTPPIIFENKASHLCSDFSAYF